MEVDGGFSQISDICCYLIAAHALLKCMFTEDKKCHNLVNLINWLKWMLTKWGIAILKQSDQHRFVRCLDTIMQIKWQDRIPDTEVLKRAGIHSVHTLLKLEQLRWTCYQNAWWMFAKENLLWRTTSQKTLPWWQEKRYKDTLKASLKDFSIPTESWEQIAQDRTKWQGLIGRGAGEYEAKRISEAEQKLAQQKARAKASPTELSSSDPSCSICNR